MIDVSNKVLRIRKAKENLIATNMHLWDPFQWKILGEMRKI